MAATRSTTHTTPAATAPTAPSLIRRWKADAIPDQTGRVALITGANSGIGFETAKQLAHHGAHVILACRDQIKANTAIDRIQAEVQHPSLEALPLDLADQEAVTAAAATFTRRHDRLDLLINNAGVMAAPYRITVDGFELQLATNHLGHFALTGRLLDHLLSTAGSRVVTISSPAHRLGRVDLTDLASDRSYHPWAAYGRSKLANLLFSLELDRRLRASGAATVAVTAHPGWARTNLSSSGPSMGTTGLHRRVIGAAGRLGAHSAAAGALPMLYAATAPGVEGGSFYGPAGPLELIGPPALHTPSRTARRPDLARDLWEHSESLTGVTYDFSPAGSDLRRSHPA